MTISSPTEHEQQIQREKLEKLPIETVPLPKHDQLQQRGGSNDDASDAPDGQIRPRERNRVMIGRPGQSFVSFSDDIDDDSVDQTADHEPPHSVKPNP